MTKKVCWDWHQVGRCRGRLVFVEHVVIVDVFKLFVDVNVNVDVDNVDFVVANVINVWYNVVVLGQVVEVSQLEESFSN
jgi:hypothetical protein